MTAKSFMEKHGLLDREEYLKRLAENQGNVELVNYPLEKIRVQSPRKQTECSDDQRE